MTVQDLFAAARLNPEGPIPWLQLPEERQPGVYVVSLTPNPIDPAPEIDIACVREAQRDRWLVQQPVIYIRRATRSLRNRLTQFYRHKYGKRAPHRGGQAVIPLQCDRWIYWAVTPDPIAAEAAMIRAFREKVGKLPYGNRRR
jgi:hypothetical protein